MQSIGFCVVQNIGFDVNQFIGYCVTPRLRAKPRAPAATPPEVIASLQKSVAAAIRHPAVNKKLTDFGVEPVGSSSAEFAALIASESTRWQKLIRELKIFLD